MRYETFEERQLRWGAMGELKREETARLAILNGPLPKNPAHLTRLVEVRSLGGFAIKGEEVPAGKIVMVEFYVARDLVAQGKAVLINA